MSSLDRLKEYANPLKGPSGAARDQKVIDQWSARATANSQIAKRASDGPMKLPSTGKRINVRNTETRPLVSKKIDALMKGDGNTNYVGSSSYMPGVVRKA